MGLGYLFWQSFDEAVAIAKQGTLAVGAIALLLAGAIFASRLVRNRRAGPRDRERGGHSKAVVAGTEGVS